MNNHRSDIATRRAGQLPHGDLTMAFAYYRPKANYDSGSQLVLDMSRCLLFDLRSRSKPELRRPNAFSELWISCWHLTMLHNEVGSNGSRRTAKRNDSGGPSKPPPPKPRKKHEEFRQWLRVRTVTLVRGNQCCVAQCLMECVLRISCRVSCS